MGRSAGNLNVKLAQQIPLFSGLEPEQLEHVNQLIRVRRYHDREVVVREGDGGGALFVVLSGYTKAVTSGAGGQELLLSIMGPNEVFGELSLLDGQPRSASVIAVESAELATLEREPFERMLEGTPRLAIQLLGVLSQRVRSLSKRYENVASMDVRSRLAEVLVVLADKHGKSVDAGIQIPVKLSQQDLGSMIGTSRESVNKVLSDWIRGGVLSHVAGRVTIADLRALRSMIAY